MYKYFKPEEFARCTPSCCIDNMDGTFMESLDAARHLAGIPFVLNSAYRPVSWEIARGRSGSSFHTLGKAVDIRCTTSWNRFKIVDALIACGFKGIGISKTFIHVDSRKVSDPVIWLYNEE